MRIKFFPFSSPVAGDEDSTIPEGVRAILKQLYIRLKSYSSFSTSTD
jgi:hypothetical protein